LNWIYLFGPSWGLASCVHSNELFVSIQGVQFRDYTNRCKLLAVDCSMGSIRQKYFIYTGLL